VLFRVSRDPDVQTVRVAMANAVVGEDDKGSGGVSSDNRSVRRTPTSQARFIAPIGLASSPRVVPDEAKGGPVIVVRVDDSVEEEIGILLPLRTLTQARKHDA
jgi:hypothetical protein